MAKNSIVLLTILILLTWLSPLEVNAQCAMCKAVVESSDNVTDNQQISGEGINAGILYIIFIPYILLCVLGWMFYRTKIKGFLKDMNVIRS
jgi:amino acid transporter